MTKKTNRMIRVLLYLSLLLASGLTFTDGFFQPEDKPSLLQYSYNDQNDSGRSIDLDDADEQATQQHVLTAASGTISPAPIRLSTLFTFYSSPYSIRAPPGVS